MNGRYVQLIRVFEVNPDTLEDTLAFAFRAYATDVEAEQLGHQLWRSWMRANPLTASRMSFGRRNAMHDAREADSV